MSSAQQLVALLRNTLHPQFTVQATNQLQTLKTSKNFTTNLILISDQQSIELPVKISALVYLKNLIEEQFKNQNLKLICHQDLTILKQSIFSLLVKLIHKGENKLLPTMKYICFLFTKYLFKENQWDELVPELLKQFQLCESFETVKATLVMVKILFQILGKSLTEEIKLNNLSNKIILPLASLASKMYANLSEFSFTSLQEIFKIMTEAIEFHLPKIIEKNIHIFMVLVKNVLDMKTDSISANNLPNQQIIRVLRLKKQALIFLQKMYQRHATTNLTQQHNFVEQFNKKYTRAYFETIVGIIMGKTNQTLHISKQQQQTISSLNFVLITHALSTFSYITGNKYAGKYIEQELEKYQLKILYLSMEKFLMCHSRKLEHKIQATYKNGNNQKLFENFTDFIETFREQRQSLRLFLTTIFSNKNVENRQKNIQEILQLLLKCITEGSLKEKQLALYLLANLQRDIELLNSQTYDSLNQKMIILLKSYVYPLLSINTQSVSKQEVFFAKLIKLRAYEMYRRFEFLHIGQQHSIQLCEKIFEEFSLPNQDQVDVFVKIQAIETFNQILGTDHSLIPKLEANIPQILRIYTDLLSKDFEVMKYYQEILSLFSEYISPVVHQLLDLLCDMFFKLNQAKILKFNCLTVQGKFAKENNPFEQDETVFNEEQILEESDNQTIYEDIAHDYDNIGSQCLASIKKLIFKHNPNATIYKNSPQLQQKLLLLIIHGLSTQDETFTKQSLAILNLLLYKNYVSQNFHYLLPVLLYPVFISSNQNFADQISAYVKNSPYSMMATKKQGHKDFNSSYIGLLKFICKDIYSKPFQIFDQIGCIKNFIKVLGKKLYSLTCPISGRTYLQMLVETVIFIEQAQEQQSYSKSQVLSILSIYQALLENKIFQSGSQLNGNKQTQNFSQDIYFEALVKNIVKWSLLIENSTFEPQMKQRFKSFYFRIIMIAIYAYPQEFFKFFELQVTGNTISPLSYDYPFEKVFGQLSSFIVEKALAQTKPLFQLKEESLHVLNDSYVTFQGIVSLIKMLVSHFIIQGQTNNLKAVQQRLMLINQRTNCFFSRIYYTMIKLSMQVAFLTAKQYDHDNYEEIIENNNVYKIEKSVDQMLQLGYSHNNLNKESQIVETNILITMLSGMNMTTYKQQNTNEINTETNSQLSEPRQPKLEVQYLHQLKHAESMMDEPFSDSDESECGSEGQSDDCNMFECSDEEYLYAYDSVAFGGSFMENRKAIMEKIIKDLALIYHSEQIYLLKQMFLLRI